MVSGLEILSPSHLPCLVPFHHPAILASASTSDRVGMGADGDVKGGVGGGVDEKGEGRRGEEGGVNEYQIFGEGMGWGRDGDFPI